MDNPIAIFLILALSINLYLLPAYIARAHKHHNKTPITETNTGQAHEKHQWAGKFSR